MGFISPTQRGQRIGISAFGDSVQRVPHKLYTSLAVVQHLEVWTRLRSFHSLQTRYRDHSCQSI